MLYRSVVYIVDIEDEIGLQKYRRIVQLTQRVTVVGTLTKNQENLYSPL